MNLKQLLFIPPLAVGIAALIWMNNREAPPSAPAEPAQLAVRVMDIAATDVSVKAKGYGRVVAAREWSAVSQVQGRVIAVAEGLSEGRIVEAGEQLIAIDPTDYELALERAKVNVASAETTLEEIALQEANTKRSLEVQEEILEVSEAELDRAKELLARGTGTNRSVESAQSAYLAQQSSVVNLQNSLDLYPAQEDAAEASLKAQRVSLSEAEVNLTRTTIAAPFRGRVNISSVQLDQYIRVGESLVTVEDISVVEVTAEIQPQEFLPLAGAVFGPNSFANAEVDAARAIEFLTAAGVEAVVHLELANGTRTYPATLARFRGTVNPETGTIGVTVRVDDPLLTNRENDRPPLAVGAFVSVELSAPPSENVIVIPRAVVRRDDQGAPFVYVADPENQLEARPIATGIVQNDKILVSEGLNVGDRLILSDPRPPIPGISLIPVAAESEN